MKIQFSAVFSLLMLSVSAPADEFSVAPRLCVQHAHQSCVLQLTVSWQQAEPVCLYQQHAPETPLLCQAHADKLHLALPLQQDTLLQLKNPHTGAVLAQRQLRLLQIDLQSGEDLLNKSQSRWWWQ